MGLPQSSDLFRINVGGTQGVAGTGENYSITWAEMLSGTEAHLQEDFNSKVNTSLLGAAGGVATLNSSGIIHGSQLPEPSIGGFALEITTAQEDDLLLLKSSKWRNTPKDNLVDGGNF